jgi:hypothetical protein
LIHYNNAVIPKEFTTKIKYELIAAENARATGNEARARVCSRRAAGLAIQAYYATMDPVSIETSAIDNIKRFQSDPKSNPELVNITNLLLTRVEKDYSFPSHEDVLVKTRQLIQAIDSMIRGNHLE